MFEKVLIANRGEIAVRVIRACRELGVRTVAVYSEADRDAMHVRLADESVLLGPAPSRESYLVKERILNAATNLGADGIHPGYGFLSENAEFVRMCEKAGVKFIGPDSRAMQAMGDKVSAKQNAIAAGVPVAPASKGAVQGPDEAREVTECIGLPVIVKAVHGGGGMGMRIVRSMAELEKAVADASAQAASAFGSEEVFIERFVEDPRHIEYQILGDEHGHVVHLGERDCSVQRRNQKLLEEAPSPALTPEVRATMGELCVKLAKQVGYSCAGTMEFLYKDGEFFFMEMNTRLQVEHPVTELVYGVDLVEWQLRVASGEELTLKQADLKPKGWAIEARVNAENPFADFLPTPGPVESYLPPGGPGVRVDSYLYAGYTVPSSYDSLVAKLIAFGEGREQAIRRLRRALGEYHMGDLVTNIPFHQEVLNDPAFVSGDFNTGFLRTSGILDRMQDVKKRHERAEQARLAAALAAIEAQVGTERFIRLAAAAKGQRRGTPQGTRWQETARREAVRRWG
jgi:acetyl-CoA carboxylase, biotin carboxylase subunit